MVNPAHIQVALQRIVDHFHPARVILFGSQARGDAGPHSDTDLLVLLDAAEATGDSCGEMYRAIRGVGSPFDIVVMSLHEFEETKSVIGTVARPAAREGRVLYERAA